MANISDLQKRYKSLVTKLQESFECPLCSETIKPPFKVCVKGHGGCIDCAAKLENKCPLCQESFILENLVCIKNVLEVLPNLCRYSNEGCEEVVELENDHAMFCGYRPMICQKESCSEKVPVIQFLEHYKTKHPKTIICKAKSEKTTPDSECRNFTPVSLFDHLFWVYEINDMKEKQFKIFFQAAPIGKLNHNYYLRVTFEKGNFVYTYTLKASVLSPSAEKLKWGEDDTSEEINLSDKQYCMRIPQSELSHFKNDDGELKYSWFFFRV